MKRVTTTLCIAAVMAWSMALAAQNAPSDQTQQPRGGTQTTTPQPRGGTQATTPQARENTSTVSIIGCVESTGPNAWALNVTEQASTTATAGTSVGATAGTTQVGVAGQAQVNTGTQTTGTGGTVTTGVTSPAVGQKVQLIGSGRVNIGTHAGHKVEVTGTMVPQGQAQGRTTGQPAAEMRLNVSNVRMISAMCSSGTSSPQTQPRNQGSGSTTQPGSTPGAAGTSGTSAPVPDSGSQPTTQPQPEEAPQRQQ